MSRASSAMRSAPRRFSTGCCGDTAFRHCRSGWQVTSCAAVATMPRTVESAAILFTVLLAFMEIRHAVNGGDVFASAAGLTEVALQVCVALAMAIGLERLRMRTGSIVHNVSAILLTVFAGLATVFGLMALEAPILWPTNVGGMFINVLLLGYALPAVLALLLSYAVAGRRPTSYANTIAVGALVLAL